MAKKTISTKTISSVDDYNKLLKKYQNGISAYGKKIGDICSFVSNLFSRLNNNVFPHINKMFDILDDCQDIVVDMPSHKVKISRYDYWRILRMQTQTEDIEDLLHELSMFETTIQDLPKAVLNLFMSKELTIPEIVKQVELPGKIEKKQLQDSYNELLAILDDNKNTHQRYKKELTQSFSAADLSEMMKIGKKIYKSVQIDPLKDSKVTKLMKDELTALEQEYFRYKKAFKILETTNKGIIQDWTNSPISSFLETDFIAQSREVLTDVLNFIKETAQHGKFQLESYILLENRLYDMQNQLDEFNEEIEDYDDEFDDEGIDFISNKLAEGFASELMSMFMDKIIETPKKRGGHLKRIK